MEFWDCIPEEKKGGAFAILAQLYYQLCGEKLEEPDGLRGEPKRKPNIINAPNYEEDRIDEINREMSLPAHSHKLRKEEK